MTVAEDLTGIAEDLHRVDDMLRWAISQAWWPAARPLDAPRGRRAIPPLDPTDPDLVPGPRYALGVGDHRAQQAIRTALRHLAAVETELDLAIVTAMAAGTIEWGGRPLRWGATIDHPARLLTGIRWRTVTLAHTTTPTTVDPAVFAVLRRHVRTARREIDMAWRTLDAVVVRGTPDGDEFVFAPGELCRICEVRPIRLTTRGKKAGDGRCETCKKWRQRNGFERPKSLDEVHEARRWQKVRTARGEGWGDESLSATRLERPTFGDEYDPVVGPTREPGGCGTTDGYRTHLRNHQPVCEACRSAWRDSRDHMRALIRTARITAEAS